MRVFKQGNGWYFACNLLFHMALEVGWQWEESIGFSLMSHGKTQGDHRGFVLHLCLWGFFFECAIYDTRHWNWRENRFYLPGEEEAERALATMSASAWKDVPAYTQAIDACMPKEEAK